ncbi:hypothetical protein F3Y22_tig00112230pilonHSYRG00114 [Hibiscus syriacus]|uniref:BED-type domain-containing protein n=1 Tax=Hibiscus syriacus TaxID=106335 RepID=A0A6A2X3K4_HIBSY|nr:hypothetical protein F3Y22_tig00112230pilonHSYRG00114 [Hibiscus syriacus]
MSSEPQSSSTPIGVSRVEEFFVNVDDEHNEEECNIEASEPTVDSTIKEVEVENPFQAFKRPRRSKVWDDFLEPEIINEQSKVRCKYCKHPLSVLKSKSTTHLKQHLDTCLKKSIFFKQQQLIVKNMVDNMKERFDKYWGECNLLMAIESEEHAFSMDVHGGDVTSSGLYELLQDVFSGETSVPRVKYELDSYLDEGMAVNILAVLITTVASEATLSAGSRVIYPYRSSLTPETVQMLMSAGDWCRS